MGRRLDPIVGDWREERSETIRNIERERETLICWRRRDGDVGQKLRERERRKERKKLASLFQALSLSLVSKCYGNNKEIWKNIHTYISLYLFASICSWDFGMGCRRDGNANFLFFFRGFSCDLFSLLRVEEIISTKNLYIFFVHGLVAVRRERLRSVSGITDLEHETREEWRGNGWFLNFMLGTKILRALCAPEKNMRRSVKVLVEYLVMGSIGERRGRWGERFWFVFISSFEREWTWYYGLVVILAKDTRHV